MDRMLIARIRAALAGGAIGFTVQEIAGDLLPESCPPLVWVSVRLLVLVAGTALALWVAFGIVRTEVTR